MATTLAEAYVQILPSADGIGGALSEALNKEAGTAGTEAGETAGSNFAGKMKGVIAAAGIGMAVKGAIDTVNSVATAGDEIDKTSQKLGVAADEYQALSYAAEHCGFSTSAFTTATKKLQKAGYEGTLYEFLNGLMEIDDVSQRTALAQDMLGEATANQMAAYLNGTMSMTDYYNSLSDLGGMMSNESVAASAAYADAMTDMNSAFNGVKMTIVSGLIPAFTDIMNGISLLVSGQDGGFEMIVSALGSVVSGIVNKIPEFVDSASKMISSFLAYFTEHLDEILAKGKEIVESLINGITENLPEIISSAVEIIGSVAGTIVEHLPEILEAGVKILLAIAEGIIKSIPKLVASLPKLFSSVKSAFEKFDWLGVGKNIINGIIKGIKSMGSSFVNGIVNLCKRAFGKIKSFFGINSPSTLMRDEIGRYIPLGLAEGIASTAGDVNDAMSALGSDSFSMASSAISANVNSGASAIGGRGIESQIARCISLLSQLSGLQVVMDSGALVGQLAAPMDAALGSRRSMAVMGV